MIYLYNETPLTNLSFVESVYAKNTCIALKHTDATTDPVTEHSIDLIGTTSDVIKEAIHNRYAEGVQIKNKIARDYCVVKNHRILIDTAHDELVDLGLANQKIPFNPSCVKNMIVLILHKDSKYFVKKKYTVKKPFIFTDWVNDTKVITLYLTVNNWNSIPQDERLSILIESGYGSDHNTEITMTGVPTKNPNANDNRPFYRNVFEPHDYKGTFPILKNNRKPVTQENNNTTVADNTTDKPAPVYGDDYKYSSIKPGDDGKRYESRHYNNFRDKDADDDNYSKKFNGHPKKNKKFNKNSNRY